MRYPQRVTVAFGRGDGTFNSPTNYSSNGDALDIKAIDIDGNGSLDLVVSMRANTTNFCVLPNRGDGTFAAAIAYSSTNAADTHQALNFVDLNADGRLDVVVLNYNFKSLTIWINKGNAVFVVANIYSLGFSPTSIACTDFNGDGANDLIVRGGVAAVFLLGKGDGSFSVGSQMSVPSAGSTSGTIAIGDFNSDGKPDLAFVNASGNSVAIMLNESPPTLQITPLAGYNQINWLGTFGAGYTLDYTTNLSELRSWQPFPYPPVIIGNQKAVADWATGVQKFYRQRKP
jgi:hypothetical protein